MNKSVENLMSKKNESLPKVALNCTPEIACADYLKDKNDKYIRKKVTGEEVKKSPLTDLIEYQRIEEIVNTMHQKKTEEKETRRQELDEEWLSINDIAIKMQSTIQNYLTFVRQNEEKRNRARRKIEDEKRMRLFLEKKLSELEEKVQHFQEIKRDMENYTNNYQMYADFLKDVAKRSDDRSVRSVQDILIRYRTLKTVREDLKTRQENLIESFESSKNEMIKLTEENHSLLVKLKTNLEILLHRFHRAKENTIRWEEKLKLMKNIAKEKEQELDKVRSSCWNLYTVMSRNKVEDVLITPENTKEQVLRIKKNLLDLKKVVLLCKASNRPSKVKK